MELSLAREWSESPGYGSLTDVLRDVYDKYGGLRLWSVGESICGREIHAVTLGSADAEKSAVYVGCHHALEWVTAAVLIRFIEEYCEAFRCGGSMYGVPVAHTWRERRITVIPMLNPDGVELHLRGIGQDFPLAARVRAMSGGDLSLWQANARGVDLNHNYNAGFSEYKVIERKLGIVPGATKYSGEYPESEPEVAALCRYLRYDASVRMLLTLHTQGEVIYSGGTDAPAESAGIGKAVSRMSGYALENTEGTASYGGLTDWFVREFSRPAFTLECGKGVNPLPGRDFFGIYTKLRKVFFMAPYL